MPDTRVQMPVSKIKYQCCQVDPSYPSKTTSGHDECIKLAFCKPTPTSPDQSGSSLGSGHYTLHSL